MAVEGDSPNRKVALDGVSSFGHAVSIRCMEDLDLLDPAMRSPIAPKTPMEREWLILTDWHNEKPRERKISSWRPRWAHANSSIPRDDGADEGRWFR